MKKTCYICGETKELISGFSKNKQRKDGYDNRCKTCRVRIETERMANLTEEQKEAYRATWRKRNFRNKYKKYGLTFEEYEQMYEKQNGTCLLCKTQQDFLVVDHDHDTDKVRGLLCNNCNLGLGHFKDSVESLLSAAEYLRKCRIEA